MVPDYEKIQHVKTPYPASDTRKTVRIRNRHNEADPPKSILKRLAYHLENFDQQT